MTTSLYRSREELTTLLAASCACHAESCDHWSELGARHGRLTTHMSCTLLTPLVRHALELGVDPDSVSWFAEGERVDVQRVSNWLRDHGERIGEPRLGLHALAKLTRGAGDLLELAAESAPTLRAALALLARGGALLGEHLSFHLHVKGADAALSVHSGLTICQALKDYQLGVLSAMISGWLGEPKHCELWFSRCAPSYAWEYRARLSLAYVGFDAPSDALVFPAELLDQPSQRDDPALHLHLVRCVERSLEALGNASDLSERIRKILPALLPHGQATMEAVASKLQLRPRTLSRHLEREGMSFSKLLDEVRRERSVQYLKRTSVEAKIIAEQLGYSTPAAFTRAFTRWYSQTPGRYREAQRSGETQAVLTRPRTRGLSGAAARGVSRGAEALRGVETVARTEQPRLAGAHGQ